MKKLQTVFVGLSGGVDSAVAAARLQARGFNVVGVFIKVWHPDFMVCNWEAERLDAMRVAAHLDISFLTCDAETEYRDEVAHYFIEEYRAGRTPNPDVMCNQYVKFGAFSRFAKREGADYIATGHYAQKIQKGNDFELHRGVDSNKDQTYFLWSLSKDQLSQALFPVGDTPKEQIRVEAEKLRLPVATKKDSQGVCFLGQVDIPDFLSHYIELITGSVLNNAGEVIGEHKGALVYTLGQRQGFTLVTQNPDREPMFVVARDVENNTITVSATRINASIAEEICLQKIVLRQVVSVGDIVAVQIRYRQTPLFAKITSLTSSNMIIQPSHLEDLPAKGQSCVLYRDTLCLGGGIIS